MSWGNINGLNCFGLLFLKAFKIVILSESVAQRLHVVVKKQSPIPFCLSLNVD